MRILATSDLHGRLPDVPECELLLLAGDICPDFGFDAAAIVKQSDWLETTFRDWLKGVPAKSVVGVAGNHDFVFEHDYMVPDDLLWTYLEDELYSYDGVSIYGTPWVPNLPRWAFYGGMEGCIDHFNNIPVGVDILLSHGPFHGACDIVGPQFGGPRPVGCTHMAERVHQIKPKVFVTGHIHEAYGHMRSSSVEVYNVAHCNDRYEPINPIVEIEL